MYRKFFNALMAVVLVLALPASIGLAQSDNPRSREPIAIGAMHHAGKHLARPREEAVISILKEGGKLPLNATELDTQTAVDTYYEDFNKKSSEWVNPEMQQRVFDHEQEMGSQLAPQTTTEVIPVSVKVFGLAVDFGAANEYVPYSRLNTTTQLCEPVALTETHTGPRVGQVPHPGLRDNNTVWYEPWQIADPNFYSKLIFGYEGVGEVRPDLIDPRDGTQGIDLTGYTVQDYYDHLAGPGNVTLEGQVEGWITVPHTEAWYGAPLCLNTEFGPIVDDDGGGDVSVNQIVIDALDIFQAQHPNFYSDTSADAYWPQFDDNGDGWLDTLWIIHAGMGEEAGGGAQGDTSIWSHSSELPDGYKVYEGNPAVTTDDIYAGPYTVQPEHTDLGVLVEEFGHNFFGWPDLYTTDAQNSIGFWSEMSAGSWGGPLGGSIPVGMPLWFMMNAWCGDDWCNWQEPMLVRNYNDALTDYTIGQMEEFPGGPNINKGVRISLPQLEDSVTNRTGTSNGKAAYSGFGVNSLNQKFVRAGVDLSTGPYAGSTEFSFISYWDIETLWDFGYVEIKLHSEPDTAYILLADKDNKLTNGNPYGNNDGWGLTGKSTNPFTLRFDIPAAYQGKVVDIRLRYETDAFVTEKGWWVDNFKVSKTVGTTVVSTLVDDFEAATAPNTFPGWTNDTVPWKVVPYLQSFTQYYLVEWRSHTKYDESVRTAYVTTYFDPDEWQVERVPYNIPGALVYYRTNKYGQTYDQRPFYGDPPSYGPKNKLLLVDMNYEPMGLIDDQGVDSGVVLNSRASSYDAALTLQPTEAFTINSVNGVTGGPFPFVSKAAVPSFNDALGYYAGYFYGDPCPAGYVCYSNRDGSAVIPARGNYSVRFTDYYGNPIYELYGYPWSPSWFGSGNPGDDMVQYGVNIELLSKSTDDKTALVRVYNHSVDATTESRILRRGNLSYDVVYTTTLENVGTETAVDMRMTYTLDPSLSFVSFQSSAPVAVSDGIETQGMVKVFNIPSLGPGDQMVITMTTRYSGAVPIQVGTTWSIHDGQIARGPWSETTVLAQEYLFWFPFVLR